MTTTAWRWCGAWFMVGIAQGAAAQQVPAAEGGALQTTLPAFAASAPLDGSPPRLTIVEVPDTTIGIGPRRPHHALSIRAEAPQRMLRTMGFDAAECATRLRMPSKIRSNPAAGSTKAVVEAQIGLACRF